MLGSRSMPRLRLVTFNIAHGRGLNPIQGTTSQGKLRSNLRRIATLLERLAPDVVALQTAGWLNKDRDLKEDPMTAEEKAMMARATSNKGYHYYGEGRFFILLGKAFADTMLELTGQGAKALPPELNAFSPPNAAGK